MVLVVSGGERRIKLQWGSSSSEVSEVSVVSEDRVDLGSIARMFGIVPATLKLHGHFLSRGLDLVASSVTWNSLLSFFSARGLSTATILLHGNHLISNKHKHKHKRSHSHDDVIGVRTQLQDINLLQNKRLCKRHGSEVKDSSRQVTGTSILGFKRKQSLEDLHHLKKLKMDETNMTKSLKDASSEAFSDFQRRGNNLFSTGSGTQFACSYMSNGLKRPREDVVVVTTSCKKIR